MLTKVTLEAALNAELDDHLGYERYEKPDGSNYALGIKKQDFVIHLRKSALILFDQLGLESSASIARRIYLKLPNVSLHNLAGIAVTMTTREIVKKFMEKYCADVSASLISKITGAVIDLTHTRDHFRCY